MSKSESQQTIPEQNFRLPETETFLKEEVSFPFETAEAWAGAFNHLKFKEGEQITVEKGENDNFFTITLPKKLTIEELIETTGLFIQKADIKINNPYILIFCRDLRNMARVAAEIARTQNFSDQEKQQVLAFVDSLFQFALNLEETISKKNENASNPSDGSASSSSSTAPINSLDDERLKNFEWSNEQIDIERYKNELLLRMLGKHYQSFAPDNQQDKKLGEVPEHSTYYFLFKRYLEGKKRRNKPIPNEYQEQIEEFDQWLIQHKRLLFRNLFPYISQGLREGGRTQTAFFEIAVHTVFTYLDQSIADEGWKKAKETLHPPPLFSDIDPELQKMINKVLGQNQPNYSQSKLFELATEILTPQDGQQKSTKEKIKLLWDLIQAYMYKETYTLTAAIKNQEFECNLRSYILGKLYQELMSNEVEVYTVLATDHTFLLVVDKESNNAYWVDPTAKRFFYDKKRKRKKGVSKPFVIPLDKEKWFVIQTQIQAHPDDFHIFNFFNVGDFSRKVLIRPFRQGIEQVFWFNIGFVFYNQFKKNKNKQEKQQLAKKEYYCYQKALEFNPNDDSFHNRLAILLKRREFAEAQIREQVGKLKGEELTDEEERMVKIKYINNLLEAYKHYQKALELNPNYVLAHNNLANLLTTIGFAEAQIREEVGKLNGEKLTDEEKIMVEIKYINNLLEAYKHYQKALELKS